MKPLISLINSFLELRRFKLLTRAQRDIIFYAESESYLPYLHPFIKELADRYNRNLVYVTSSDSDPLLKQNNIKLKTFCITHETIRTIFFAGLDANILVMTLLDLGRFHIKRSHFPVHYVFVPHNVNSTHMVFRKGAHNQFDTIFCVGPHQHRELRKAEQLYKIPRRSLVKNGYVRLDSLWKTLHQLESSSDHYDDSSEKSTRVLLAPSWGATACLFQIGGETLVSDLVDAGFNLTIRPHRHITNKTQLVIDRIRDTFRDNANVSWDDGSDTAKLYFQTDILITDWSGAAFSFAFTRERPVLFIDTPMKVRNQDYGEYDIVPFELQIRSQLGTVLQPDRLDNISEAVTALHLKRQLYVEKIRIAKTEYTYNLGNAAKSGAEYLFTLAQNCETAQNAKDCS